VTDNDDDDDDDDNIDDDKRMVRLCSISIQFAVTTLWQCESIPCLPFDGNKYD